jgi:hypothetical protein
MELHEASLLVKTLMSLSEESVEQGKTTSSETQAAEGEFQSQVLLRL